MNSFFKKLGLSDKETRSFLTLLEIGAQPISNWAKRCKIPRPTMYLVMESLREQHLIEVFDKFGMTYVKAISPKEITQVLNQKATEVTEMQDLLQANLTELEKLESRLSLTPKVKFYEGAREVSQIYELIIRTKPDEFCAIFSPKLVQKHLPKYANGLAEALYKNKTTMREVVTDNLEGTDYVRTHTSKHHQVKILKNTQFFPSDLILIQNQVFLIAYGENQISGTHISSPEIYAAQKVLFEQTWEHN